MKYLVTKSFIQVIGKIWMPPVVCGQYIELDDYKISNIRNSENKIDREAIEFWLALNAGDFQTIEDFYADIEAQEGNIIVNWAKEESELIYNTCMYGN